MNVIAPETAVVWSTIRDGKTTVCVIVPGHTSALRQGVPVREEQRKDGEGWE